MIFWVTQNYENCGDGRSTVCQRDPSWYCLNAYLATLLLMPLAALPAAEPSKPQVTNRMNVISFSAPLHS
jgi:hypothetical protein